jgi:hypothetical protein
MLSRIFYESCSAELSTHRGLLALLATTNVTHEHHILDSREPVLEPGPGSGAFIALMPARASDQTTELAQLPNSSERALDGFSISNSVRIVQELDDKTVVVSTCRLFYPVTRFECSIEAEPTATGEPGVVRISERKEHFVDVEEYEHSSRFGTRAALLGWPPSGTARFVPVRCGLRDGPADTAACFSSVTNPARDDVKVYVCDGLPGCRTVVHADRVAGRVCEFQHSHLFASYVPEVVELFLSEVEYATYMSLRYNEDVTRC